MLVQNKTQLLSLLNKHRQEIQDFGVERCGIFSSFVRDAIHAHSDVDILVVFQPERKRFYNFIHLSFFLEDLLGRSVDLVTIESLSPYIGQRILSEVEYVPISA
ncbi:nucleotidyltransferase family protein [Chroococcus sp. FPU101]|uniref:nucleotidyltransferase family protein n=1 Tax=Chroococcus sp. FPU101 TaxID=1974212 RepID=UPI001A8CEFE0|nr:nucleotidyltransferase family protein [Chroococcus sp. FPU101]GFE71539.1 DNA polymerase beta subunit [Chroococcus sp. FPU101]